MITRRQHGTWVIAVTFLLAMVLTVMPLPHWGHLVRPEWTALVLIYWVLALPHRVGIGVAWAVGILLDTLTGTLLGQHALSLSIIAYLSLKLYKRVRLLPLWQQSATILGFLGLHQLITLWILGLTGQDERGWTYWLPSVGGMVLWPVVFVVLRDARRRFGVM